MTITARRLRLLAGWLARGAGYYVLLCAWLFVGGIIGFFVLALLEAIGVPLPHYADVLVVTLPGWAAWIIYWRWRRRLKQPPDGGARQTGR